MAGAKAGRSAEETSWTDDADRLIQLFVHDLRAPLGVATGYLRLLQDGRLGTDADQGMALSRTLDALGRIATLCDTMVEHMPGGSPAEPGRLKPGEFVARVASALTPPLYLDTAKDWPRDVAISVGRDGHRFADGVALVLNSVARRTPGLRLTVTLAGSALRFSLAQGDEPATADLAPFDPWRGFGLELVLACRAIQLRGGLVSAGSGLNLAIELPLVSIS